METEVKLTKLASCAGCRAKVGAGTLVQLLEFPSSLLLAISFLLAIYLVHRFAGNHKIVKELKSIRTARILLAIGAILLAIEGTWSLPIHKSVGFSIYVLLLLSYTVPFISKSILQVKNQLQSIYIQFFLS